MKTAADPRFLRRRSAVREEGARLGLRRAFKVVFAIVVVAFLVWFAQSPPFSVRHLDVDGAVRADVATALEQSGLVEGRPMIRIRADRVTAALEADPWVSSAEVDLSFPDRVTVVVEERREVASIGSGDRWMITADDGRVMSVETTPRPDLGVGELDMGPLRPGDFVADQTALGVTAFIAALEGVHGVHVAVRDGELWADVDGYPVRLGDARDAVAKARAVEALLAAGPPSPGSVLVVVAPERPAVIPSNPQQED